MLPENILNERCREANRKKRDRMEDNKKRKRKALEQQRADNNRVTAVNRVAGREPRRGPEVGPPAVLRVPCRVELS